MFINNDKSNGSKDNDYNKDYNNCYDKSYINCYNNILNYDYDWCDSSDFSDL